MYNLISLIGMAGLVAFAWLLSSDRKSINYRVIYWGVGLELIFGLLVFLFPLGSRFFLFLNDVVNHLLGAAMSGAEFLFGRLAYGPGREGSLGFFLAFQGFPTIIFFSALAAILYHFNILQKLIRLFSYIFSRTMKISGAESLAASANIFLGVESAMTVRPFLGRMTQSELCTVLTAGMATVASNILAVYVFSLNDVFPTIAAHLMSASILSAPAAIVFSKILCPESETPETLGLQVDPDVKKEGSLFEAIINGSMSGLKMIAGIAALLVAVLGLVAVADLLIGGVGDRINLITGLNMDWSIAGLLGYVFYPFTLLLGVAPADAYEVSKIIGSRLVVTELTAYGSLAEAYKSGLITNPRSLVVCSYALCGFAHVASMAIFIGGISALVPGKTPQLVKVGLRALLAANLACLMTACVSGLFFTQSSLLFKF